MNSIKISVVVPTYSRPLLLQKCLHALANQKLNNFVITIIKFLIGQRMQAFLQQQRSAISWYYYRNLDTVHFSIINEPIINASNGDVQKHSMASLGVQTIGFPK